jgi:hypothetical protein
MNRLHCCRGRKPDAKSCHYNRDSNWEEQDDDSIQKLTIGSQPKTNRFHGDETEGEKSRRTSKLKFGGVHQKERRQLRTGRLATKIERDSSP